MRCGLIALLALAFVTLGDGQNVTVIENIPMLANVLGMFNDNDTSSGLYRLSTLLKLKLTDLGFPRSKVRFRFRPLVPETKNRATIIVGGCILGTPQTSVRKSEVFTKGTVFTLPDNPVRNCEKWTITYFQGKAIFCGGDSRIDTPCVSAAPNDVGWQQFVNIPQVRKRFLIAATPNYIGLVGSSALRRDVLVLKNNTWRSFPMFPTNRRYNSHALVGFDNDELYSIGGRVNDKAIDQVFIINLETETVTEGPTLLKKFYAHSATIFKIDGETYIAAAGGLRAGVRPEVEILKVRDSMNNPVTSQWEELADMQNVRTDFALGVLGNRLTAFGGRPVDQTQKIESYNPETKKWEYTGEEISEVGRRYATYTSFEFE